MGVLYVHMDAALRDRLSASTFRTLNWAMVLNAGVTGAVRARPRGEGSRAGAGARQGQPREALVVRTRNRAVRCSRRSSSSRL